MTRILDAWRHAALPAFLIATGLLLGSVAAGETPAADSKPAETGSRAGSGTGESGDTPEKAAPVTTRGTSGHIDSMTDRSSSSGRDMIERNETHLGEDGSTTTITTVTDEEGNTHQAVLRRERDGTVTESNTTQPAD